MRVGFDISQTGRAKAGCGYYAAGLIQALEAADSRNKYILYPAVGDLFWDPECAHSTFAPAKANFERFPAPVDFDASRQFWLDPRPGYEERIGRPDVFHSNNFFCPWGFRKARLVYTLYDLSFLREPDWSTEANRVGCLHGVFKASVAADWIVAISEYSRLHFLETFPHYPKERTSVIYPASRYRMGAASTRPAIDGLEPGKFWLSVGTIEPRKNYAVLLDAYRILHRRRPATLPLVVCGGKGWLIGDWQNHLDGLVPGKDVIPTGYVADAELAWLFENCFAFVYPSLFEGFGMPVLEALSLGAPVLCSNVTSLPEVAADAALYFDPGAPESIASAMALMADNPGERSRLRLAGPQRAGLFSWDKSAAQLIELYDRVGTLPRYGGPSHG
jgi:glycosyltransferase involved in cell wall biosynthesis